MTRLEETKARVQEFDDLASAYSYTGATDSEVDYLWQKILSRAAGGMDPKIPQSADAWELYTDQPASTLAAAELTRKAEEVCRFIGAIPLGEAGPVIDYLSDYCWRVA